MVAGSTADGPGIAVGNAGIAEAAIAEGRRDRWVLELGEGHPGIHLSTVIQEGQAPGR